MTTETNNLVVEQQEQPTQLHPYTPNTEPSSVCAPNDKECLSRLVAAFGDCA